MSIAQTKEEASGNRLGIPCAVFIENVESVLRARLSSSAKQQTGLAEDRTLIATSEQVLGEIQELYTKYKMLEANLDAKRGRLHTRLPELRTNLALLADLHVRSTKGADSGSASANGQGEVAASTGEMPFFTSFLLSEQVYARARVDSAETVLLWLGANTLLEYPLEEARTMLSNQLSTLEKELASLEEDLEHLREQCTVSEVNLSRLRNWRVGRARQASAGASGAGGPGSRGASGAN